MATLVIDRPERHNAMTWEVIEDLRARLGQVGADPAVRVLVLAGAGDKAFSAGADLGKMTAEGTFLKMHEGRGQLAGLLADLRGFGKPVIARVQGFAMGGGFGLALACDMIVASTNAVFGLPEINAGLWPYMVTVPVLESMPPKIALELMMTGRRVSAMEAERIGFVNKLVEPEMLDGAVADLAETLAAKSPAAMSLGRPSFYTALGMAPGEALPYLHALLTVTAGTDDAKEGSKAFAEKREARFTGA